MDGVPLSGGLLAAIAFGALMSSLIPAVVVKVLMALFFQRTVGFLMVLLAMVVSVFLAFGVAYAMGLQSEAAFAALPPATGLILTGVSMLGQAILLSVIVPDDVGRRIPLWKWIVVLVLQYVVYIVFGVVLALAL